jgi:HSF-type DNA-binding
MVSTTAPNNKTTSPLANFTFPRTGKRGVPQQFPRRLYEMLDGETKSCDTSHPKIISWSASGKAFRIHDVAEFAEIVLPKYFRTKKFSSFQRNLNLVSSYQMVLCGIIFACSNTLPSFCIAVWIHQGAPRGRHGHVRSSFLPARSPRRVVAALQDYQVHKTAMCVRRFFVEQ